jgi:5-methylcytosine-specific restriction endonuclease McrA
MSPQKIISWERAVVLVVLGKVDVIEEYDETIRSPSLALLAPSVVRLKAGGRTQKQSVRFSRINVYARDGFRCQYCGAKKPMQELNYDHVVPRARGGKTDWDNIVTSCYACNDKKGGRSPEEAGMRLRKEPRKPSGLSVAPSLPVTHSDMRPTWLPYCSRAEGSERVA